MDFSVRSIKFRLLLVGLTLALAGLGFRLLVLLPSQQRAVRDLVAGQQLALANYVARDVGAGLEARLRTIETLADDLPAALLHDPAALQSWLRQRQRANPAFNRGLLVAAPDGRSLFAEYPASPGRGRPDFAAADWLQKALRSEHAIIGQPLRGGAGGEPILIVARALRGADGGVVAVAAGVSGLDAPGFLDRLQEARLGGGGGFRLISPAERTFVAASDEAAVLQPLPPPGADPFYDQALAGFRGTGLTRGANGAEELAAVAAVPGSDWFVVAHMPTAEAFRPVYELRREFLDHAAFALSAITLALLLVVPRLLRPLSVAAREIHAMAAGERPLAPLPVGPADEVGRLVAGFNRLVERLQAQDAALRASEQRLEFLAHHDALTGLPNRACFEDRLDQVLARAARDGSQVALLFCDLDGFKPINDEFGHETGDRVLQLVAERLGDGRRRSDTVARLGGDEFVLLLSDLDDAGLAGRLVAEQCIKALTAPFEVDGRSLRLGVSIGIAVHDGRNVDAANLLSQADAAMYRAKRAGRGRFAFAAGEGDLF